MKKQEIIDNTEKYILNTYTRMPLIFVKGKGCQLMDIDGKKYLDFFPGWGVSNVGHCHPKVMSAIRDQVGKLLHVPNNTYIPPQVKLAKELIRLSFPGKVFFCNSGAEANEAAIKIARAYGHESGRYEIITFTQSFHGRTFGAMSATAQQKIQHDFMPIVEGFKYVPFNDIETLKKAITNKTIGIMLELVQGEGGIHVADHEFVNAIRSLCDQHDMLMMVDEVQTGFGRTGEMFAYKHYGIKPDTMALAKALGGGVPIGAMIASERVAGAFKPGMHGSTFAGSHLMTKAALGNIAAIQRYHMLSNTKKMGQVLFDELKSLQADCFVVKNIRGMGLMVGVELSIEGADVVKKCMEKGLLINCTQGNILRLMPALIVTRKQIKRAVYILKTALKEVTA